MKLKLLNVFKQYFTKYVYYTIKKQTLFISFSLVYNINVQKIALFCKSQNVNKLLCATCLVIKNKYAYSFVFKRISRIN